MSKKETDAQRMIDLARMLLKNKSYGIDVPGKVEAWVAENPETPVDEPQHLVLRRPINMHETLDDLRGLSRVTSKSIATSVRTGKVMTQLKVAETTANPEFQTAAFTIAAALILFAVLYISLNIGTSAVKPFSSIQPTPQYATAPIPDYPLVITPTPTPGA